MENERKLTTWAGSMLFDSDIIKIPENKQVCPLCKGDMYPLIMTTDCVCKDGRSVMQDVTEQRIVQFTVWMCNMNCDQKDIYRKVLAKGPRLLDKKGE